MINVRCQDFTDDFDQVNGDVSVHTPKLALYWATITVGKPGWGAALAGGWPRIWEMISLIAAVEAYLEVDQIPLRVSQLYRGLEQSEKATVSYRFGMAFTKLVAWDRLRILHLRHLYPLIEAGAAELTQGSKARGDLVGRDEDGRWHVVEAKGWSSAPGPAALDAAKQQAQRVSQVHQHAPRTRCVCFTHLGTPIEAHFRDPHRADLNDPLAIRIDEERFFRTYYQVIVDLQNVGETFHAFVARESEGMPTYMVANLPRLDLQIGVESGIYRALQDSTTSVARYIRQTTRRLVQYASSSQQRPDLRYLAPDGFLVGTRRRRLEAD